VSAGFDRYMVQSHPASRTADTRPATAILARLPEHSFPIPSPLATANARAGPDDCATVAQAKRMFAFTA